MTIRAPLVIIGGKVRELPSGDTLPMGGDAGGVLSGTYPNPGFAVDMATQAELDAVAAAKLNATNPSITGTPTEDVYAITDGAGVTIDPDNGSIQTWTLGANRTPTLTSIAAGQAVTLEITAGAYTITWTGVTWIKVGGSGSAPTLSTTGVSTVVLWKVGSTLKGCYPGST